MDTWGADDCAVFLGKDFVHFETPTTPKIFREGRQRPKVSVPVDQVQRLDHARAQDRRNTRKTHRVLVCFVYLISGVFSLWRWHLQMPCDMCVAEAHL